MITFRSNRTSKFNAACDIESNRIILATMNHSKHFNEWLRYCVTERKRKREREKETRSNCLRVACSWEVLSILTRRDIDKKTCQPLKFVKFSESYADSTLRALTKKKYLKAWLRADGWLRALTRSDSVRRNIFFRISTVGERCASRRAAREKRDVTNNQNKRNPPKNSSTSVPTTAKCWFCRAYRYRANIKCLVKEKKSGKKKKKKTKRE